MNISEVSEKYALSPDTLRYYERIGLIPKVHRTPGGIRAYEEGDLKWVEFVKCMRSAGLSIEVLIKYIRLFEQGDTTLKKRKELLLEQRHLLAAKIHTMQETLALLDRKIEGYNGELLKAEHKLAKK
ncbi:MULTISPECIES: MerR family transcriptional regulator [unclassified Sporolactobacillus]|uniref:MerR family transcriptional regulator n=1 Tax=unclassified Sporolactobacillus TaxID=2628533 RepID=UPI002368EE11|nr:MerR family transcriptional regulator [Sporolactobacillus sp. CQH2019]MDD9149643.1 MerR family transcriptional regulator [Sporolactobacillus sp. CQH2019]